MILAVDTSNSSCLMVSLAAKTITIDRSQTGSDGLLAVIIDLLRKEDCLLTDITAIKINPGPGSFTGLRVGFSVANLLGWYLQVPVNGQKVFKQQVALPNYE